MSAYMPDLGVFGACGTTSEIIGHQCMLISLCKFLNVPFPNTILVI